MKKVTFLLILGVAGMAACDTPTAPTDPGLGPAQASLAGEATAISVLTRNLYLGANLDPIGEAPASQVPFVAAGVWAKIQATDFPTRAQALADEIAAARPDLVGLQEVTTWRTQTPSDIVLGVLAPNATTVEYDFLATLLDALAERGLDYHVAALSPTSDLEIPVYTGVGSIPFMDVRWGDADAVLVRADVEVLQSSAHQFAAGGEMGRINGWCAARVRVGRTELTFANTHLMGAESPDIQVAQATELIEWVSAQAIPVILVGDFNSAANPGAPEEDKTATYGMLLAAGFTDVWDRGNKPEAGLTCCQDEMLEDLTPSFDRRGDLVLLDQGLNRMVGAAQAQVVGDDPAVRTAYGLWPSDHAGVFAVLHLPMWR
jgi:endonuclease/exonuclease/phosphatase family metal-dependent hydrolase